MATRQCLNSISKPVGELPALSYRPWPPQPPQNILRALHPRRQRTCRSPKSIAFSRVLLYPLAHPPQNVHTTRPPNFPQIARILSCPLARLPQHVRPTPPPFPKTKLLALPFAFCYTANCRDRPQETTGWRYYFSYAARGAGRRSFPTFSEP